MALAPEMIAGLWRGLDRAIDLLLPPQCLGCGTGVDRVGALCAPCWRQVTFIGPPFCAVCGYRFEYDAGEGALCGACSREPPPFDRARAAIAYEGVGRELVLAFKLSDRTYAAPALAEWMARAGAELIATSDLIVPVPLHRRRLFLRRYNQAALLAQALSRLSGKPARCDLLVQTQRTPPQTRLGASARRRNVRGAFRLRQGREGEVGGRSVLLIDDVLTTGATAAACAQALKAAGADQIAVLTLARTMYAHT